MNLKVINTMKNCAIFIDSMKLNKFTLVLSKNLSLVIRVSRNIQNLI